MGLKCIRGLQQQRGLSGAAPAPCTTVSQSLGVFFPTLDYETLRAKPKRFNNTKSQRSVPGNSESAAAAGEEPPAHGCSARPRPPAAGAADPPCAVLSCGTGLRLRRLCPNASEKKANVVFPSGRAARAAPIASSSRRSRQLNPGDGQQRRRDPSVVPTHPDPGSALPPLYGEQQLEVGNWNTSSQRH